jgi:nucleotide-binding universal stress UspA family protein
VTTFPARVLVGVDVSLGARAAVDAAVSLCQATGADLHLVHVKLTSALLRGRPAPTAASEVLEREGEELLARARAYAERVCPVTGTHLRYAQRVDRALARVQDELDADVLVIGAGRPGDDRWHLGRTVAATIRRAPRSVLVVRGEGRS